jgi:guanine deaminase
MRNAKINKNPLLKVVAMEQRDREIREYLKLACDLALENVLSGNGGPFGAVIVKNGEIIATGANQVTASHDPTAHAEIVAIRNACKALDSFQLTDCQIYSSCEPCPMCFGAIFWARPEAVYYCNTADEAAAINFDDSFIYEQINLPHSLRSIPFYQINVERDDEAFKAWRNKITKIKY